QLHHVLQAQIPQGIHTDDLCDLLHRVVVGDELAGVIDVRTVVAGGHKGRRADPHVDLLRPGFPQQVDGPAAGGAPDDGVVDQHHPLALHHGADGVQLDIDLVFPHGLSGGDEGAADVLVLD
ncbi:Fimbrial protein, partial [Dysosmobacter welbionis]